MSDGNKLALILIVFLASCAILALMVFAMNNDQTALYAFIIFALLAVGILFAKLFFYFLVKTP